MIRTSFGSDEHCPVAWETTVGPVTEEIPSPGEELRRIQTFRSEARDWLERNAGHFRADPDGLSLVFADVSDSSHLARGRQWQRLLHQGGWAGISWPTEHGGRGASMIEQAIWAQEYAAAAAPPGINLLAEAVIGPTLIAHGDGEQRARFLPPMLPGDEIWCQLFSEPSAGSDMAAVRTRARRQSDHWIIDGHKIWTSAAHYADFGLVLARTDWDAPKHGGCTCFVIDMRTSGVKCRPLRQMTGGAAFNEVFLESVQVADCRRIGREGDGWRVASTALGHERLALGLGLSRVGGGVDRVLRDFARSRAVADPVARQSAADLWIKARSLAYLGESTLERLVAGETPGPEGAVTKLVSARVSRSCDEVMDLSRGAGATVWDATTLLQLWVPATSIAGGTDEILRSIVAQRILHLPRREDNDKDRPFSEVPH